MRIFKTKNRKSCWLLKKLESAAFNLWLDCVLHWLWKTRSLRNSLNTVKWWKISSFQRNLISINGLIEWVQISVYVFQKSIASEYFVERLGLLKTDNSKKLLNCYILIFVSIRFANNSKALFLTLLLMIFRSALWMKKKLKNYAMKISLIYRIAVSLKISTSMLSLYLINTNKVLLKISRFVKLHFQKLKIRLLLVIPSINL